MARKNGMKGWWLPTHLAVAATLKIPSLYCFLNCHVWLPIMVCCHGLEHQSYHDAWELLSVSLCWRKFVLHVKLLWFISQSTLLYPCLLRSHAQRGLSCSSFLSESLIQALELGWGVNINPTFSGRRYTSGAVVHFATWIVTVSKQNETEVLAFRRLNFKVKKVEEYSKNIWLDETNHELYTFERQKKRRLALDKKLGLWFKLASQETSISRKSSELAAWDRVVLWFNPCFRYRRKKHVWKMQ